LDRSGLFAEHHRRVGRYQLIASGRLDWVEGRAHRIAEGPAQEYNDMGRTDFNPSLSLGAQRKLGRGYSLGFWTARSVRSAGLAERYINFFPIGSDPYELIGNPDLEPEVNYQADLRLSRVRLQSRVEVSGFVSYLEGFISSRIREDLAPVMGMAPGVRQFVNIEEALMTGGEVRWRQQWSDGFHSRLGAVYTYGEDLTRNEPLPEVPPLELRAQFGGRLLENGKLHPMLHLRHALRQGRNAAFFGETETPAFTVVDAVVQYALNSRISLTAGVENLLDAHYYEHLNRATVAAQRPLFAPGRNAYLTLSARLP
jgi:iron complex outermembrane receptor protein